MKRAWFVWIALAFTTESSLMAEEIDNVVSGYSSLKQQFRTWQGNATTKVVRAGKQPIVSRVDFAWDAENGLLYCRSATPEEITIVDGNGEKIDRVDGVADVELLIMNGERVIVDHTSPMRSAKGFDEFKPAIDTKPFALVKREPVENKSTVMPMDEFWPEFVFKGNMPSIQRYLEEVAKAPEGVTTTFGANSLKVVLQAPGKSDIHSTFIFSKLGDFWVPTSYRSDALDMTWEWSTIGSLPVPKSLVVDDHSGDHVRSFTIGETVVNEPIDSERFEVDSFECREGDMFADYIANELLIYRSGRFVPYEPPGRSVVALVGVSILVVIGVSVVAYKISSGIRTQV